MLSVFSYHYFQLASHTVFRIAPLMASTTQVQTVNQSLQWTSMPTLLLYSYGNWKCGEEKEMLHGDKVDETDEWLNVCQALKNGPTSAVSEIHNMVHLLVYSKMIGTFFL